MDLRTVGLGTLIAHYHAALAEVDRLRARVAELEAEAQDEAHAAWEAGHHAGARSMLGEE